MTSNQTKATLAVVVLAVVLLLAYPRDRSGPQQQEVDPTSTADDLSQEQGTNANTAQVTSEEVSGPIAPRTPHSTVTGSIEVPAGSAASAIAALSPLASSGDKKAAIQIFLKTNECRRAIDSAVRAAPNTEPSALVPVECADLTPQSYQDGASWLEAVADSGDEYARLLYANNITAIVGPPEEWVKHPEKVQAYKDKSLRYLKANAANGSVEAWQSLSAIYAAGVLAPQDNLKAYAYYRAAQMADPNFAGPRQLEALRNRLSPEELQQAEVQSRRVYERKN